MNCESVEVREAATMDQGFSEAYCDYEEKKLILLGYRLDHENKQKEVVSTLTLSQTETDGQMRLYLKPEYKYIQNDYTAKVIQKGFFKFGVDLFSSHIVVSPFSVRKYQFTDVTVTDNEGNLINGNLEFQTGTDIQNIAATTDGGVIAILRKNESNLYLLCTQDLQGDIYMAMDDQRWSTSPRSDTSMIDGAMMLLIGSEKEANAIIALEMPLLRILKWRVQFTLKQMHNNRFQDDLDEFEFTKKLKVMHMSSNKAQSVIQLIVLDENNCMQRIRAATFFDNMSTSSIIFLEEVIVSKPMDYFDFNKAIIPGIAQSNYWDFWFFGVTESMTQHERTLNFPRKVGFIMSTQKNRLSEFWVKRDWGNLWAFSVNHGVGQNDPQSILEKTTIQPQISMSFEIPFSRFKKKNDWILHQQEFCPKDLGIANVDSTCYYYDIFDDPSVPYVDFKTRNKPIPRSKSACNQDERLYYSKYALLPDEIKAIRSICYPKYQDTLSNDDIPMTDDRQMMVQVDLKNYELRWINQGYAELDGISWAVRIREFSDDLNVGGFDSTASFKFKRTSHYNVAFDGSTGGKPKSFAFFPQDQANDFYVKVTCWSPECPSYIKQNEYSLYTEIGNQKVVNDTYVYFIEVSQKSKKNVNQYTLSFNTTRRTDIPATGGINITYDFWDWYENNKLTLPFYAPPPIIDSQSDEEDDPLVQTDGLQIEQKRIKRQKVAEKQFVKTELQSKLDPNVFKSISDWSDAEVLVALQEAKERKKTKVYENFPKVTMDQKGLVKVSFQGDIKLPSYLKKEISQLMASDQDNRKARRERRLDQLFYKNYQYEYYFGQNGVLIKPPDEESETDLVFFEERWIYNDQDQDVEVRPEQGTGLVIPDWEKQQAKEMDEQATIPPVQETTDESGQTNQQTQDQKIIIPGAIDTSLTDPIVVEIKSKCDLLKNPTNCGLPKCSKTIVTNCISSTGFFKRYDSQCDPNVNKNCKCDPLLDLDCKNEEPCDVEKDKTCVIADEITQETSEQCDPLTDPECDVSEDCNEDLDPLCMLLKYSEDTAVKSQCDPLDPKCLKYQKAAIATATSESTVYLCNPNDPKSECYKPIQKTICPETKYLDESTNTCKFWPIYFGSFEELFDVRIQTEDRNSKNIKRTLSSKFKKKLVLASDTEFALQLEFTNPLEVSSDELLIVTTNFTNFNPGITMSERRIPCTRQVINGTATKTVEAVATSSQAAVIAAAIGSMILKTFMQASLSQLWGMINGIQFIIHIPCINLEFPANAFLALKQLIAVATFELPYMNTEALKGNWKIHKVEVLTDVPQNLAQSMDQLGYNDSNISNSMGTVYLITHAAVFGLIIILVTLPFVRFNCCRRFNLWMRKKLLWNFVIRLIFEESLETLYSVSLTFKYSTWNTSAFGSATDYLLSIILVVAIVSMPFFMVIFYLKYYDDWENEKFDKKYGAPLDGLKKDQKSSLIYPVYFVIRRSLFCLVTLVFYNYVLLQLLFHYVLTMISIIYLISSVPQEDLLEYRLELMNECFTVIVIDLCFMFTDLDSDRNHQYNMGYVFIATIFTCVGVHVIFLMKGIISEIILKFRKARALGFKQTFANLINENKILRVLLQRKKKRGGINIVRVIEEKDLVQQDEESGKSERIQLKELSEIEESVSEDESEGPQLLLNPVRVTEHQENKIERFIQEEYDTGKIFMMQSTLNKLQITYDDQVQFTMNSGHLKSPGSTEQIITENDKIGSQIITKRALDELSSIEDCIDFGALNQKKNQITASFQPTESKDGSQAQSSIKKKLAKTEGLMVKIVKLEYDNEEISSQKVISQRIQQFQLEPDTAQAEEDKKNKDKDLELNQ